MLVCRAAGSASTDGHGPKPSRSCRPPIGPAGAGRSRAAGHGGVPRRTGRPQCRDVGARAPGTVARRRRAARRPLLGPADLPAAQHRRVRPRRGWLARTRRLLEDAPDRMRRAGPSPDTGCLPACRHGRLGDRLHHRRPRRRDRRSVRRHRPGDARPQPPGPGADRAGPDRRGDEPARRGDGRRRRRRGLRDRRRGRLLQRDRGLPGGAGPAPGAAMDGGADALVRHAAGPRPVQRELPRSPRRDHAAARRVAGCARRRAPGAASGSCSGPSPRRAPPSTSRARCTGCGASSRKPRRRIARPAGGVASHSPAWRGCD